jgi:hypothetical protein
MKTKPLIFALGICLMLLTGCVASSGPGYDYGYGGGYYPPARPYYARPYYYNPRPAVIVPARPYYRGNYHGDGGYRGSGNRGGGYHGGHSRSRGR